MVDAIVFDVILIVVAVDIVVAIDDVFIVVVVGVVVCGSCC